MNDQTILFMSPDEGGVKRRTPQHTPPRLRRPPRARPARALDLEPLLELLEEQLGARTHVFVAGEQSVILDRDLGDGLDPSLLPMAHSLYMQPINHNTTLVINDTSQHPLVRGNRYIEARHIEAMICTPLNTEEGESLGSLCLWSDGEPRQWSADEVALVERWRAPLVAQILQWREAQRADERAELHRLILSTITDPLIVCDQSWHIAYANSRAVELMKRPLEGRPLWEAIEEWRDATEQQQLHHAVETQRVTEFPCSIAGAHMSHHLTARVYPSILGAAILLCE